MKWYLLALTIINRLILLAQPNVDFYADKTTIYVGDTITFYNTSTNYYAPGSIVAWTFEGGEGDQSKNVDTVKVVYNAPGLFDVTLYINDLSSDAETTKVDYITVLNPITAVWESKHINNDILIYKLSKKQYEIECLNCQNMECLVYNLLGEVITSQQDIVGNGKCYLEFMESNIYILQILSQRNSVFINKLYIE